MPNDLFNQLGVNQFSGMIQQFNEFRKTVQGDPKTIVQNLLNSGRMTQQQFNQLQQMAQQFSTILK